MKYLAAILLTCSLALAQQTGGPTGGNTAPAGAGAAGASLSPSSVSGGYFVDGTLYTTPNGILSNSSLINGGSITWRPSSAPTVTANPFGNIANPPASTFGITSTSCPGAKFGNGATISIMLIYMDKVEDYLYSQIFTTVTPDANQCPVINSDPTATVPGAFAVELAFCTVAPCDYTHPSNWTIGNISSTHSAAGYGPFNSAFPRRFDVSTGPSPIPAQNTSGLLVPNLSLTLGNSTFTATSSWVMGTYSHLGWDTGQAGIYLRSLSAPNAIPQLMKPFGSLNAGAGGTATHSETVVFGLHDGCGKDGVAGGLESVSPPYTFPPFTATNAQLSVLNPGLYYNPTPWVASTLYWGSGASSCVGERIAVGTATALSPTVILILRASTVGTTGGTIPVWTAAGSCGAAATVGTVCGADGTESWVVEAIWKHRVASTGVYKIGGRPTNPGSDCANCGTIWDGPGDGNSNSLWELCGTGGASCNGTVGSTCTASASTNAALFGSKLLVGDIAIDGNCVWLNISGQNGNQTLINPGFGIYIADGVPNQTQNGSGKKQLGGGGATSANGQYLSALKSNAATVEQFNWSTCSDASVVMSVSPAQTGKGTCSDNQAAIATTGITGTPATSFIAPNINVASIVDTACPTTTVSTCNGSNALPYYFEAIWVTPDGPGPAGVEVALAAGAITNGHAIGGPAPINPPSHAIGYMIAVTTTNATSGNELIQLPDAINFICSGGYVQSLPYGRVCDVSGGWVMTNALATAANYSSLNLDKVLPFEHDISAAGIVMGGPLLLPAWPGGAYNDTIGPGYIEMAPSTSVYEGNSWGVVNHGAEESAFPDGLLTSDTLGGAYYSFSTPSENSNIGYIHSQGTQYDYTEVEVVTDVTSFHTVRDLSCGANIGTPWLARAGLEISQSYVMSAGAVEAEVHSPQCEAVMEGVLVNNASANITNRYGRGTATDNRSAVVGTHFDQYSPSVQCFLCWNAGVGANIQDDVVTSAVGVTSMTTTSNNIGTAAYIRNENPVGGVGTSGPASPNGLILDTDPGAFAATMCYAAGASGQASPAPCGAAAQGKIAIPVSAGTTYTVNDTRVTANSIITVQQTTDNTGLPSTPTCNTNAELPSVNQVTKSAGISFTLNGLSNPAAITCFTYQISNGNTTQ